jgi:hypothetical protein
VCYSIKLAEGGFLAEKIAEKLKSQVKNNKKGCSDKSTYVRTCLFPNGSQAAQCMFLT